MDTERDGDATQRKIDPAGAAFAELPKERQEAELAQLYTRTKQRLTSLALDARRDFPDDEAAALLALAEGISSHMDPEVRSTALAALALHDLPPRSPYQDGPAVATATAALDLSVKGRHDDAMRLVVAGSDSEPGALYIMAMAWCDAYIAHAFGRVVQEPLHITGTTMLGPNLSDNSADELARWSANLIAARAEQSQREFDLLWNEAPDDMGPSLSTLLGSIAKTRNTLPDGWAELTRRALDHGPGCSC